MRIRGYPIPIEDCFEIELPVHARILTVREQRRRGRVWAIVDPGELKERRRFYVVSSDTEIKFSPESCNYVGSFQGGGDALVFHVFVEPSESEERQGRRCDATGFALCCTGQSDIEQLLRSAGAKDDGEGQEQLLSAVKASNPAAVRAALEAGANANSNDSTGNPLICDAAERGDTEVIAALLDHKANINSRNSYKATPLYLAISRKHKESATFLINAGAMINDSQQNPLSIAVQTGGIETVTLLLDKGADIHFARDFAVRAAAKACMRCGTRQVRTPDSSCADFQRYVRKGLAAKIATV